MDGLGRATITGNRRAEPMSNRVHTGQNHNEEPQSAPERFAAYEHLRHLTTGLDRRDLLRGGLLAGVGLFVAGCQSAPAKSTYTRTPGPVWPDQDPPVGIAGGPGSPPTGPTPPTQTAQGYYNRPAGVIPRSEWTRTGVIRELINPMNGISHITIHHEAENSVGLTRKDEVARRLEGIRRWHTGPHNHWADIGYHFVVDPVGRVWEARPLGWQGAHVKDHNEHNMGVMLMGNFNQHRPTGAQLATLDAFIPDQMRRYGVRISRVHTHQELMATECPGTYLQQYMNSTRSRGGRLANA